LNKIFLLFAKTN
jgi:threonine synthase